MEKEKKKKLKGRTERAKKMKGLREKMSKDGGKEGRIQSF